MPVKKTNTEEQKHDCCFSKECSSKFMSSMYTQDFGRKILWTLLGILLVYSIVFLGTLIRNNLQKYNFIGKAEVQPRTITVEGVGEVTARPDVAMTTMGMVAEASTVAEAQQKNTQVMNNLIEKLKALGVSPDDLQTTNYNVYPQYDYPEGGQVLRGYSVSQDVQVKIRDLAKANQVLALAGEVGATNVGGLQFTVDERDAYIAEAREEALQKVSQKVLALSQSLGVRPVRIAGYNEFEQGGPAPIPMMREMAFGDVGGLPTIEAGTTDVVLNVQVTFEIR
ncbi:MAG: hypothetical protein A3J66_01780 [Candidatus Magasanikbacteria bacterium RIFCSPHIGHO2_02_FULL_47_14]|uniref:SIMPL domain-containing protein n=1 Tax=Candidatus Magasanikbacteria bacterium RIFCSPHIGHO2_02_FULL_47_14 TaxID=1798680 RepID=A0A1F6M8M9_9BACT|nr:MAG: hypothetical protein A3J66_01780 [Candidatus Magasanikbacteria bacterium RIFCSPHIGHO2_02_FULL_47_14]